MFPERRMRRARSRNIQPLLREIQISRNDLVAPLFVDELIVTPRAIEAMPGQFRYPVKDIGDVAAGLWKKGIRAILLFGIPKEKDPEGSSAYDPEGIIQQATRRVKARSFMP